MVPIITLTTDMGLDDAYVAAMKGVILGISPEARLIDICHTIRPQDIAQAAFFMGQACPYFPAGTIHLAMVDPGVGTDRRGIILKTKDAFFVAPDNGILSYVVKPKTDGRLPPGTEAVVLTRRKFWRKDVSATFHGRDIFAPVAAHLSLGRSISEFGETIDRIEVLKISRPRKTKGGLTGHIIHVDTYGNLITDIAAQDLPRTGTAFKININGRELTGLSRTYADTAGLLALIGSGGYLEIAEHNANAAATLRAKVGDKVNIIL
jgi:S-adenosyl-L-methionine hydrolase (adenosine-forming)